MSPKASEYTRLYLIGSVDQAARLAGRSKPFDEAEAAYQVPLPSNHKDLKVRGFVTPSYLILLSSPYRRSKS
jgi:hypothetical protein